MTSQRKPHTALVALALFLATAAVYSPVVDNAFLNYDDTLYLTENPIVQRGLSMQGLRWAFDNHQTANWHPATWLGHMLVCQLFGLEPVAHHLVSVALHALSALVLFLVLCRMGAARWPSACVAALFSVHPLRVESVAWAAELKDVLSGLCFLLALLAYARHVRAPSVARHLVVSLALVVGLMAKPMLVTLPFVLLLLDRWPLRRWGRTPTRALLLEKLPWLVIVGLSAWITFLYQRHAGAVRSADALALSARVANAFDGYGTYLTRTLWPHALAIFHPHPGVVTPDAASWNAGAVVWAAVVVLLSAGSLVALGRSRPWLPACLPVGWLWFVGMLVPVIGVVQVGEQAWAERYAYLPTIGLYLALVFALARWVEARPGLRFGSSIVGLAVVLALAGVARRQVRVWRDSETIFRHALVVTENNHVAHFSLAAELLKQGSLDEAGRELERAIAIQPRYANAHYQLGALRRQQGRGSQALQHFRRTLEIQPWHVDARVNVGLSLGLGGDLLAGIAELRRAVSAGPDSVRAARYLALLLAAWPQATPEDAREGLRWAERAAAATDHRDAGVLEVLAAAHAQLGDFEAAQRWQARAVELSSGLDRPARQERLELFRQGSPLRFGE